MKKAILLLSLLVLAGCQVCDGPCKAAKTEPKDPLDTHQVQELFTQNGCTIYRFRDRGDHHYFTTCKGSTSTTQNCGKNCTEEETTQTE